MDTKDLCCLAWLILKLVVDVVAIGYIIWRLRSVVGNVRNGIKSRKDWLLIGWEVTKRMIDFVSILYLIWRLR